MKKYLSILIVLFCSQAALYAQYIPHDGTLDSTFGYSGTFIDSQSAQQALAGGWGVDAVSMAIQNDGHIMVLSSINQAIDLMKFTPNGFPDPSFCASGIDSLTNQALYQAFPSPIVTQNDGKTIFVTYGLNGEAVIARFLPNGQPDSTFNDSGLAISHINGNVQAALAFAIQPDGKYVICGKDSAYTLGLIRYNANGSVDTAFCHCSTGKRTVYSNAINTVNEITITPGNKIIVAGGKFRTNLQDTTSLYLLRFNSDGTLDNSFGGTGFVMKSLLGRPPVAQYLKALQSGKILLVASTNSLKGAVVVARLNMDGTDDTTFGTAGADTIALLSPNFSSFVATALQTDSKILIATNNSISSTNSVSQVVRLSADGAIDSTFGFNGRINVADVPYPFEIVDMKLQSNGDILVMASFNDEFNNTKMFLARYIAHTFPAGVELVAQKQPYITGYPNPSTGIYYVKALNMAGNATVMVYDITGRAIYAQPSDLSVAAPVTIDLTRYAAGMYFAKVQLADGSIQTVKLLKE